MIEIKIRTDGKRIFDAYDEDNPTLKETALIIYRLEQMKLELLSKEFESEFEVSEDQGE